MASQYYSEARRRDSDVYLPAIKRLVGQFLLIEAPLQMDLQYAADLILMKIRKDLTIAARVRNPGYAGQYGHEFTFRANYETGHVTELDKVLQGLGDWFFYGHGDGNGNLVIWWLINLHIFRANVRPMSWRTIPNGDGTYFTPFKVDDFPPEMIIGTSEERYQANRKVPPAVQMPLF